MKGLLTLVELGASDNQSSETVAFGLCACPGSSLKVPTLKARV
jgi:hypothetical protein